MPTAINPATTERILVAIRDQDDGEILLGKALRLAATSGGSVHLLRVVYDEFVDLPALHVDQSTELKQYLLSSEETLLTELIDSFGPTEVPVESATVWERHEWETILDVAADINATLIMKGVGTGPSSLVRTPGDWHLLRHAQCPVLMATPGAWSHTPRILAALNTHRPEDADLNKRILRRAADLANVLDGRFESVTTYPSVEHWVGPITLVVDFNQLRGEVIGEIRSVIKDLERDVRLDVATMHTIEGDTADALGKAVAETQCELLVMGTHQRSGPRGTLMGNTSEAILSNVSCDVVVIR